MFHTLNIWGIINNDRNLHPKHQKVPINLQDRVNTETQRLPIEGHVDCDQYFIVLLSWKVRKQLSSEMAKIKTSLFNMLIFYPWADCLSVRWSSMDSVFDITYSIISFFNIRRLLIIQHYPCMFLIHLFQWWKIVRLALNFAVNFCKICDF